MSAPESRHAALQAGAWRRLWAILLRPPAADEVEHEDAAEFESAAPEGNRDERTSPRSLS